MLYRVDTALNLPHLSPPQLNQPSLSQSCVRAQDNTELIVLDACILMSGVLRPLLLDLAQAGLFKPVWSTYIGVEWRRNAARLWPIDSTLLNREWTSMQQRFPMACCDPLPPEQSVKQVPGTPTQTLRYSDAKDHHVILAGVRAKALNPLGHLKAYVLTWNIRDFNRQELRRLGLGLLDPDRLLSQWWPTHTPLIRQHLERVVNTLIAQGRREPAPMADFLHRERLFRFKQLYMQAQ